MQVWLIEEFTYGGTRILDTAYSDKRVCELKCIDLKKTIKNQDYYPKEYEGTFFRNTDGDFIAIERIVYKLNMQDVPTYIYKKVFASLNEEERDAIETYFNRLETL